MDIGTLISKLENRKTVILQLKKSPAQYVLLTKERNNAIVDSIGIKGKYLGKERYNIDTDNQKFLDLLDDLNIKGYKLYTSF